MGLFSKKQLVCARCGRTWESRLGGTICEECRKKEEDLRKDTDGYIRYAKASRVIQKEYSYEDLLQIREHRDGILRRYPVRNGITTEELQLVSDNYRKLGEEQAAQIMARVSCTSVNTALCAYYTDHFFVPYQYERTIVDAADVYAAAMDIENVPSESAAGATEIFAAGLASICAQAAGEAIFFIPGAHVDFVDIARIILFTNDPYIPVFSIGIMLPKEGKKLKRKDKPAAITAVQQIIYGICPNLKQDIMSLKDLKKQVKKGQSTGCAIPYTDKQMLGLIQDGETSYDYKNQTSNLPQGTMTLLAQNGYLPDNVIAQILKMSEKRRGKFWTAAAERAAILPSYLDVIEDTSLMDHASDGDSLDDPKEPVQKEESSTEQSEGVVHGEWYCPSCGRRNNGNFCGGCGRKRP